MTSVRTRVSMTSTAQPKPARRPLAFALRPAPSGAGLPLDSWSTFLPGWRRMPSLPSSTDGWAPSRRSDYHRRHDPLTVAAHDAASATQSLQPIARRRGPGRARAEPCPRWRVCPMITVRPVGTRPESETMRGIHEPHSVTRLEHSESLGPTSLSAVPSVPGGPSQLGSELGSSRAAVSPRSAACKKASGADGSGVGEVEPRSSPQENARTEPVGLHRLHRQCRIRGHRPPGRGRRLTTA